MFINTAQNHRKGDKIMGIKTYNPYTPSRRNMTGSDFSEITKKTPEKALCTSLKKNAGRNNQCFHLRSWDSVQPL